MQMIKIEKFDCLKKRKKYHCNSTFCNLNENAEKLFMEIVMELQE